MEKRTKQLFSSLFQIVLFSSAVFVLVYGISTLSQNVRETREIVEEQAKQIEILNKKLDEQSVTLNEQLIVSQATYQECKSLPPEVQPPTPSN